MNASVWLGTVAGMLLAAASWATGVEGTAVEETWSPRAFCLQRGGVVTETRDPEVHVCCYAEQDKCLEVDARRRSSVRTAAKWALATGHGR